MLLRAQDFDRLECPSGWSRMLVGDVAAEITERAGTAHERPILSVTKHHGIVRADAYFNKAVHGRDTSNYKVVRPGQFAYATIHLDEGSIGRLEDGGAGLVSPMYTVFEVTGAIDPQYLFRVLKAPASIAVYGSLGQGTVNRRASISFEALSQLTLQVPPLPEQRKIAAILSSVDETIEKTEAVIDQLQVVKKAMMEELLTRGMPGRHTRFKQTEIGEMPYEWKRVSLPDVATYQNGKAFPSAAYGDSGVLLIRPGNLHDDGSVRWDEKHTTRLPISFWENQPAFRVSPGEMVMNLTAQSLEDAFLGRVCVVPEGEPCLLNQRIARITPFNADPRFLYWALSGPHFRRHVERVPQGSKVQHLYNRDLDAAPLALPPLDEQRTIAQALDSILGRIVAERAWLATLGHAKRALAESLLSGDLRVTPDEAHP